MGRIALWAAGLFMIAGALPAQPAPNKEQLAAALRDLGADDYLVREKATNLLWSAGLAAEPTLRQGLLSSDAEVVSRCRDLLEKIPYGITPASPREFVALVARGRIATPQAWPEIVIELLRTGPDGLRVARVLADQQLDANRRSTFRRAIDKEGWRVAARLIAAGDLDGAQDVLGRSAAAHGAGRRGDFAALRHYATFLRVRGTLDGKISEWQKAAQGPAGIDGFLDDGSPDQVGARAVLAYLAKAQGDFATERRLADEIGGTEWREMACFDAGAWSELVPIALPTTGRPRATWWPGLQMLYARMSGNGSQYAALRKEFAELAGQKKDDHDEAWMSFRILCFDHRPDDAIALADGADDVRTKRAAAELLAARGRPADAVKLLAAIDAKGGLYPHLFAQARLAATTGDAAAVTRHVAAMQRNLQELFDRHDIGANETAAAGDVIKWLVGGGQMAAAADATATLLSIDKYQNAEPFPPEIAEFLGRLYPAAPNGAAAWYEYFRKIDDDPPAQRLQRLPALLDRRLAEPARRKQLDTAVAWARERPPTERGKFLRGFSEAAQAAGLTDLATTWLTEAAKDDPAVVYLVLGDRAAESGRWADASAAYAKAAATDPLNPLPLFLQGLATERAGDVQAGSAMQLKARLLPLGDEAGRFNFCDELAKRQHFDDRLARMIRQERQLIVDLSLPGAAYSQSDWGRPAQGALSSDPLAYADPAVAAAANERFLLRMARTNAHFVRNESYLTVLHRCHGLSARAALAKGDLATAMAEARAAHAQLPTATGLAVDLVPELTRRGKSAEADEVYNAVAQVCDRLLTEYPESAAYAEKRAWLAARCRRDLDRAAILAKLAVELAPHDTGHRETLSEVQLQQGDRAAAVATLKDAIALAPRQLYLVKLLRRAEAGDPAAALPER